ncbi:MAG: RNA polymerase sigma factor region1.1 domain-containing protein, partial [Burkholderiales bacterium]|nr:RNA polymerase sigma factor region1.1 domain-containing protein [Burkholderiales bacterium]
MAKLRKSAKTKRNATKKKPAAKKGAGKAKAKSRLVAKKKPVVKKRIAAKPKSKLKTTAKSPARAKVKTHAAAKPKDTQKDKRLAKVKAAAKKVLGKTQKLDKAALKEALLKQKKLAEVKPALNGKVGRREKLTAKEKALVKEFERRELSPADAEARRTRLKNLIVLGKERGFLTYAEINDHLPDDMLDAEQIESIISMINDMGIQAYDHAPDAETLLMSDAAPAVADEDAVEEAEAALSTVDSEFGRTTDPVRMYMREMGSVELLTREGEI